MPSRKYLASEKGLISRVVATELINKSKGRIFTVTYRKKDQSIRVMNCRLGVTQGVKGTGMSFEPAVKGLKPVFDMQKKEWRMLNLETVSNLKIDGKEYSVMAF